MASKAVDLYNKTQFEQKVPYQLPSVLFEEAEEVQKLVEETPVLPKVESRFIHLQLPAILENSFAQPSPVDELDIGLFNSKVHEVFLKAQELKDDSFELAYQNFHSLHVYRY